MFIHALITGACFGLLTIFVTLVKVCITGKGFEDYIP